MMLIPGIGLMTVPYLMLDFFKLSYGEQLWIPRMIGLLAFIIGVFDFHIAKYKLAKLYKITVLLLIILFSICSCKEYLTEKELKYMPYRKWDILIFENKILNLIDTITISDLKKFIPDGPQLYFNETIKAETGKNYSVSINAGYGKNSHSYLKIENLNGKFYLENLSNWKNKSLKVEKKLSMM